MKYLLTFTVVFFLLSCQDKKPKHLEGVWIGTYEAYVDQEPDSLFVVGYLKDLFEIKGDSIHFKTFDQPYDKSVDTVKSFSYRFNDNILIYGNDSLVLDKITADSLVIKNNALSNYVRVYKRAEITSSPDISIEDDLYAVSFKIWKDSLQFRENGLVLRVNDRDVNDGQLYDWYISSYKELKFLVVIGQFDLPYLISGIQEDHVELKLHAEEVFTGSLKQLQDFENGKALNGKWEMQSSENPLGFLPYFGGSGLNAPKDKTARLTFGEDSLEIEHFGAEKTLPYWKDKTSRHLFFEPDTNSKASPYWKIEWITDTTFYLTTNEWVFRDFTFKKVNY